MLSPYSGTALYRNARIVDPSRGIDEIGTVFIADGNQYFNRPGPRLAESLEILAELLHPEVFGFGHEGVGWERL